MYRETIHIETEGEGDFRDITGLVRETVAKSRIRDGIANVFVTGSTAAVTTIEFEPGVLSDLSRALSVIAPSGIRYEHDNRWGDGNGRSHVKASVVGPSLSVPVVDGELFLGTWQQIVFLELDIRDTRRRTLVVTVMG
jgi:secondary thiamine-phosphate synthase enzyme